MIIWLSIFLSTLLGAFGAEPPVLRLSMTREPTSLEWNDPRPDAERFVVSFLMRGLMKIDGEGRVSCDLCRSFTVSDEGRLIRFEMLPLKWSDGAPLMPAHFVDAYKRVSETAVLSLVKRFYAEGANLVLELKEPSSAALYAFAQPFTFPIRKDTRKLSEGPTLGPYVLAAWEKGKRIVLEGNPEFKGARPVYRIDFALGSRKSLVDKFSSGKIDILVEPTTVEIQRFMGHSVQVSPLLATRALVFNFKRKPMRSPAVRGLVAAALRRELLPGVLKNGERAANSLVPPPLAGARSLPWVTADPQKVSRESSSVNGSLKAPLEVLMESGAFSETLARWLESELKSAGIQAAIQQESGAAYAAKLDRGDFDLAVVVFSAPAPSPLEFLKQLKSDSKANPGSFASVAYDSAIERLHRNQRSEDLAPLTTQATQILEREEIALLPLGHPTRAFILGKRVRGFAVTPFGDPDFLKIELATTSP